MVIHGNLASAALLLAFAAVCSIGCPVSAGESAAPLVISAQNGPFVDCRPNSSEPVAFAASELNRYLAEILGTALPQSASSADTPRIVLKVDESAGLTEEGYEYRVEKNTLHITGGGPLGVVFGAYAFLKDFGGCRFADLGPDGEYVPRKDEIVVDVSRVRREPRLAYRGLQFSYGEDEELNRLRIDWMAKNGFNYVMYRPAPESYNPKGMVDLDPETKKPVWPSGRVFRYSKRWFDQELRPAIRKRGLKLDMNHHNLGYWVPPSRYFEKHPEWYAEIDGERGKRFSQLSLCLTNDEPVAALIESVRKYLRANPEVKVVGVIPEDGVGMCQCAKCVAADPDPKEAFRKTNYKIENRSKSWRYHTLLNKVAAAIAEEFPDVTVGGAAYVDLLWPARDLDFEKNTTVWVALYWRDGARTISCRQSDADQPAVLRAAGAMEEGLPRAADRLRILHGHGRPADVALSHVASYMPRLAALEEGSASKVPRSSAGPTTIACTPSITSSSPRVAGPTTSTTTRSWTTTCSARSARRERPSAPSSPRCATRSTKWPPETPFYSQTATTSGIF